MNHPTEYKTYSIVSDWSFWKLKFMFYPTAEGIQHDVDSDGVDFLYVGNCKWADSIEEAKLLIDEIVPFYVETYTRRGSALNITKFDWLSDAIRFAGRFNGELSVQFTNP